MLRILVLFMYFMTAGCLTVYSIEEKEFPSQVKPIFLPISVLIDDGTKGSQNAYPYDAEIYKEMLSSGLFTSLSGLGSDYALTVSLDVDRNTSQGWFLLSSATMLLMPIPVDSDYSLDAQVWFGGVVVANYSYGMNEKGSMIPLMDVGLESAMRPYKLLLSHFLADLEKDRPLPEVSMFLKESDGNSPFSL